jgi:predicted outer membrane repeat protein
MHRLSPWIWIFVALAPGVVNAGTYRVGSGGAAAGCTHTTLQGAVNAAQASAGPDFIRIVGNATYGEQSVSIDTNQDLTIFGGYVDCLSDFSVDGTRATLDGAGGSNAPVIRIRGEIGTTITLAALTIRNGDASPFDGEGGGIRYQGGGVLDLSAVSVINNQAAKGGGIYATGEQDAARLVIGSQVTITGNTATRDGGGVFVNGMKVEMLAPDSIIAFNEARGDSGSKGYGGGLAVRSTGSRSATAYIGSGGVGALGAIYGNEAKWGGGVAVSAGDDAEVDAFLMLYTVQADRPAAIRGNFASEGGGAIYLWPNRNAGGPAFADAHLSWAELTDNAAPEGAAVYVDNSTAALNTVGGSIEFHPRTGVGRPPMPGALNCAPSELCNVVSNNVAESADGSDTDGALFFVDDDAFLTPGRVLIERNRAGRVVDAQGGSYVAFENAVIAENAVRTEVLRSTGYAYLTDSTLAANSIGSNFVIAAGGGENLGFTRSILWQPGTNAFIALGGGTPSVNAVISNEVATLNAGPNAIVAEPRFIDPARADYRLRAASPAIDFTTAITGDDRDAHGLPRDQRIPIVPRADFLIRDIGAFERPGLLPIVLNGDFTGDTNLWFLPVGHVGNFQTVDAPGSTGGSAQVADLTPNAVPRLLGYAQCIHIPGPGTYALNGSARSGGSAASEYNRTALIWELRSDGGEGCIDGPILLGNELTLSTTDAWNRPAQPAIINVSEVAWTSNTSLTLILAVYPNAANTFNGVFDRITLEIAGTTLPDGVFGDGFEAP